MSGTIIVQSFRTQNVPAWIDGCMATVRDWAASRGHAYHFIDDAIFALAPDWYREKAQHNVCLVTDLGRLVEMRRLLTLPGVRRTIWIDADVLIFDPDGFDPPDDVPYAFCREIWVRAQHDGAGRTALGAVPLVNNAVCLFQRDNPLIDFYIHAAQEVIRAVDDPTHHQVGTLFLTQLEALLPNLPLMKDVGLFSPIVTVDAARGGQTAARFFMRHLGQPIHAANLCRSLVGKPTDGVIMTEADCAALTERLLADGGACFNDLLVS